MQLLVREYDEDPSKGDRQSNSDGRRHGDLQHEYQEFVVDVDVPNNHESDTISKKRIQAASINRRNQRRGHHQARRALKELFLPIGFPSSVEDGYLEYQLYDSLQGLCSYLRGVLCSAQVLEAAGVGSVEATALSAAMTWALKDGVSMIGGLFFSYLASPLFDSYVKEFRLFADVVNDVGLTLDMLAPYFGRDNLLWVASAAGLCKTLCGISAGATKSSITLHFAREGNMADLNAKESTQETLVSLLGMILGVTLARWLQNMGKTASESNRVQWIVFIALTMLHVWANWKGVLLLRMKSLNRERAEQVLSPVIDELCNLSVSKQTTSKLKIDTAPLRKALTLVPMPSQVNESIIASTMKMIYPGRLRLSSSVEVILGESLDFLKAAMYKEKYVISIDGSQNVLVSLLVGCSSRDELKAFVHALVLLKASKSHTKAGDYTSKSTSPDKSGLIRHTYDVVCTIFPDGQVDNLPNGESLSLFRELENKGWEIHDRLYVGFSRRRSQWIHLKAE